MQYPPTVRIVRIPCTGTFDITYALRAFQKGADAVFVAGCKVGECAYESGNLRAMERVKFAKMILDELGIGGERLEMFLMSAAEADKFVAAVNEMTERLKKLGPNPLKVKQQ
ncbi:methyl-viologen-reducing hydrogenase delta subunit [Methanocaldococcus villosus KIN24-T80]|uniref:Methyl-viologen-reducing hydrogenase delta subunit n=2 Tax=Methanocaldococcus villosus TaxID=667126 RepID=N6VU53_9EURY|nr:methyl-viologen-reducing hydrogenase delta subunit [Methanocaldococcus villosus KIN24-T80]